MNRMTATAQLRELPPFPVDKGACSKCRSQALPLLLNDEMNAVAIPLVVLGYRYPSKADDPWHLVDWPREWIAWICQCGHVWVTKCADAENGDDDA